MNFKVRVFRKCKNSTCRLPFQQYFQNAIPRAFANQTALAGRHSNSCFRAPFRELSRIKQHLQVAIPTILSERHSKSFPTPPTQKPSKNLYNYMAWVCFVEISLCCVLVAVGSSGFVILGTGCDRARFSVVVGTAWLQYGPSGCSMDSFP